MLHHLLIGSVALAMSGTVLAESHGEAQTCQLTRYTTVPLTVLKGISLVPADFNGSRVWLMLQINSGASVTFADVAQALHLKMRALPNDRVHFGKQHLRELAVVNSLSIGTVRWDKAGLVVVAADHPGTRGPDGAPIAGLMGMDFFQKTDFELDYQKNTLSLYSTDHCPGKVVYWSHDYAATPLIRGQLGNAYFPMELDGRKIAAVLDTMSQGSSLRTDVTRRLYGFDEHSQDIESHADESGTVVSQYRAMTITGEGLQVRQALIRLRQPDPMCELTGSGKGKSVVQYTNCIGGEAPLHLGQDVVSKLHLYVAVKENMLYYTAADTRSDSADDRPSAVLQAAPSGASP